MRDILSTHPIQAHREDCIFCRLYESHSGIIYETKLFWSQFDRFPVTPGHAEVIPKNHISSLLRLDADEWADLRIALRGTVDIIESTDLRKLYQHLVDKPLNEKSEEFCRSALMRDDIATKPDAYNYGVNDGAAAGRTIDHLHIHVIPRRAGDVQDPTGGIRNIIPGKGNYNR